MSQRKPRSTRLKPTEYVATFSATAAQRKAEEALKESERLFRTGFENTPIGVALLDGEGRYLKVNRALCRMLGYAEPELAGRGFWEISHPDDIERGRAALASLQAGKTNLCQIEKRYVHAQGHAVHALLCISVLGPAVPGKPAFMSQVLDLTERKRAEADSLALEKRLAETQKLESLGKLAGGVAHVFNNLLTVIQGHAEMAASEAPAAAALQGHLREITSAARRAAELAGTMLVYSGKARLSSRAIDLNALIAETGRLTATVLPARTELRYRLADNLPAIEADAAQLRQIVMNLAVNAAEAVDGAGGTITIATGAVHAKAGYFADCIPSPVLPEGDYVYIEVQDTGAGMDSTTQARVFDPFFSTKFTGRGLGLPAVLGIVRAHKGTIRFKSQPGSGTTFTVFLPACGQWAGLSVPRGAKSPAQRADVILVVDDEEGIRTLTQALLENEGYAVLTAPDGETALDALRNHSRPISAAVLDVIMPRMNGEQVLRELRAIRPDLPVLLMSGYSADVLAPRFEGMHAVSFLEKPFSGAALCGKLRDLMAAACASPAM